MLSHRRTCVIGLLLAALLGAGTVHAAPLRQTSTPIQYGDTVRSRLSEANPEETWQFTGQAGDLLLIDMHASDPNDLDPYLTLLDSDGTTLFADDDSGGGLNARIGPLELAHDGEYRAVAARYTGEGEYTLELVNLNAAPTIKPGKPLVGTITNAHLNDFFRLIPEPGSETMLRLEIRDDERYSDPVVSFYDLNGFITSSEYQTSGVIDPLVPVPGETYVIVVSWNPKSRGGPYELTLSESQVALLDDNVPQTGTLDNDTDARDHYFRGQAGEIVRLTVTTHGDFAPALAIRTADYAQSLFTNDAGMVLEISVTLELPRSTVYAVEVTGQSFQGDTGGYTVTLERQSAP